MFNEAGSCYNNPGRTILLQKELFMKDFLKKVEHLVLTHDKLSPEVIREKDIKLGLRNPDGTGVVVGITGKGMVIGYDKILLDNDKKKYQIKPAEGRLYYCGYDVEKLVKRIEEENRYGFEEIAYLLLTGELPLKEDLDNFTAELAKRRVLSKQERRSVMEEIQNENQMYGLHSMISHISRLDTKADSRDIKEITRQCVDLIAKAPTFVAYNYCNLRFLKDGSFRILKPDPDLSMAQNFLYLLQGTVPDDYEAHLFDICLILHAEHGGGNNSTFSVRTVSSSGANTYMAIAAGIASLSGQFHGGANEFVMTMMKGLKKNVKDWDSDKQIKNYLTKILDKKVGDKSGKIFGLGHAVYTLSDPRAKILKAHAEKLSKMKNLYDEYLLYDKVEKIGSALLSERKNSQINANVDFYSGFLYKMLGIPEALFTPIFAMSRMVGWSAHRLEQIIQGKIIRPAYIPVKMEEKEYISISEREPLL